PDRHLAFRAPCGGANALVRRAVAVVRAVGEIEAEDVRPGGDQRVEHRIRVARGADGCDDFRVAHKNGSWFCVRRSSFAFVVRGSWFVDERRTANDERERIEYPRWARLSPTRSSGTSRG